MVIVSCLWCMSGRPSCIWLACLEVLVWFVKVDVSEGVNCPLASRRVMLRRVGSHSSLFSYACFI
jgi:hypothetical protein